MFDATTEIAHSIIQLLTVVRDVLVMASKTPQIMFTYVKYSHDKLCKGL